MSTEVTTLPLPRVFDHDDMITLVVGPEEQRMTVYREFLGQDSKFFQAALKREWVEGQSREIKLPEESPIHMGYYVEHMFGLAPPTRVLTEKSQCLPNFSHHFKLLAELYILGERRLDAKYQNVIVRELVRVGRLGGRIPGSEVVNIIYQGTTKDSPARRMVVAYAMGCPSDYWYQDVNIDGVDAEFWRDLSKALLQRIAKHRSANDFRNSPVKAEDYLASEDA